MNALVLNPSPLCRANPLSFPSPATSRISWTPSAINGFRSKNNLKLNTALSFAKPSNGRRNKTKILAMVPATDRVIAALGYMLPFINSLQYGRFFFMQYPKAEILFRPLFPVLQAYEAVPYASFIAFFGLYLGVVRNPSFSRYVRFNAMQAVMTDVLLSLPLIVQRILSPRRGLVFDLFVFGYTGVFFVLVLGFIYAAACCVLGRTPRLPFIGDAVDAQM